MTGTGRFSIDLNQERFWGSVQTIALDKKRHLLIAVALPESDLLGEAKTQRNHTILILLFGLAGALLGLWLLDRAVRRDVDQAVNQARKLGRYTLVKTLGEGGMGTVYLARHAMLRRPTAVKLLHHKQANDEKSLIRFEREVQMTSSLTHPNTIAVYDYGRTPEGEFYYAMEYIKGVTLQKLVNVSGAVPVNRTLHILQQVCGSLNEAHSAGLTHRDIKPANIMLCERGGVPDVVKVLDFGLVKPSPTSESNTLSQENTFTGTPMYMAPEMITDPNNVDSRADLYSLGAVIYFMLTGEPVFSAKSALIVYTKHLHEAPLPPSQHDPDIPADVESLVLSCLEKNPSDRPSSVLELLFRVNACADANSWNSHQATLWWKEYREALGAASETDTSGVKNQNLLTVQLGEPEPRQE